MRIKLNTIFELLRNCDNYGFELLYENYFRLMYGVAFSISKNDETSKDAIQNTMFNLYKLDCNKFPTNSELSWLYKVVKNETLQLLRKEKEKISIDDIAELPDLNNDINLIVDMDSYEQLVMQLNDKQRKIVTLKIVGGLTHKEISKMLDMPLGTVMWSYNTSIKKLRLVLSGITSVFFLNVGAILYRLFDAQTKVSPLISESIYTTTEYDSSSKLSRSAEIMSTLNINTILYTSMVGILILLVFVFINSDKISSRFLYNKKNR